jgi:putative intracellular protease/amidase
MGCMARFLVVLSAADHWTLSDGTAHATGYWAEEFVVPYRTFRDAGLDVELATPGGIPPTVDPVSLQPDRAGGAERAAQLRAELDELSGELARPRALEDVGDDGLDGVFLPGGHAPMEDLPGCAPLGRMLTALHNSGRLVSAVCHGPAGLLSAARADGTWLFAGRRMTAFSDEEERQGGLADRAPWLLETTLRQRGGDVVVSTPWLPHVVTDGNLVTGQNPASSGPTATRVLEALGAGVRQPSE